MSVAASTATTTAHAQVQELFPMCHLDLPKAKIQETDFLIAIAFLGDLAAVLGGCIFSAA